MDFVWHLGTALPESDAEALFLRALSKWGAETPGSALKGALELYASDGAKSVAVEDRDRAPWLHNLNMARSARNPAAFNAKTESKQRACTLLTQAHTAIPVRACRVDTSKDFHHHGFEYHSRRSC